MRKVDRVSQVERSGPPAGIGSPGELVKPGQGSLSTESGEGCCQMYSVLLQKCALPEGYREISFLDPSCSPVHSPINLLVVKYHQASAIHHVSLQLHPVCYVLDTKVFCQFLECSKAPPYHRAFAHTLLSTLDDFFVL